MRALDWIGDLANRRVKVRRASPPGALDPTGLVFRPIARASSASDRGPKT
jgi:hypothetical protein